MADHSFNTLCEDPEDGASFSRRGYDYLINNILSGKWQAGEEINRKSVARELGVSLAPVNEAVSQLEAEGFLEVTPRRQTRVRLIRREELRGLLILREAIECQAARLYCGNPVTAQLEPMLRLASAVDTSQPATPENEKAEMQFHGALIELVGAPLLTQEFYKIMRRRLFHQINSMIPWKGQPPLDNHEQLVRLLQTDSPDEAEAVMRNHLRRGREGMLNQ